MQGQAFRGILLGESEKRLYLESHDNAERALRSISETDPHASQVLG